MLGALVGFLLGMAMFSGANPVGVVLVAAAVVAVGYLARKLSASLGVSRGTHG